MNAVTIIRERGGIIHVDESGRVTLNLAKVPSDQRAEVVALAKQHKAAILDELSGGPTGLPGPEPSQTVPGAHCPQSQRRFSLMAGTDLSECTACGQARCVMLTADVLPNEKAPGKSAPTEFCSRGPETTPNSIGVAGGGKPTPTEFCPLGHQEFWTSDFGTKICSKCHPCPREVQP